MITPFILVLALIVIAEYIKAKKYDRCPSCNTPIMFSIFLGNYSLKHDKYVCDKCSKKGE